MDTFDFRKYCIGIWIKILGKTDRKYVIKTISNNKIELNNFEHIIPNEYYLIVPASVYSIDSLWSNKFEKNKFKSFTYPYYQNGRESTIKLLQNRINEIVQTGNNEKINISFFINKNGITSDIEVSINYKKSDKRIKEIEEIEEIEEFIESLNKWTPAKVKGKSVKSKVTIFGWI